MTKTLYSLDLQCDPLVEELRRLGPELLVDGGSFSHCLPHPGEISPQCRLTMLRGVKEQATARCLENLLASAGLGRVEPERLPSGARDWPAGYVGSVSKRGTKVVAALIRRGHWAAIGIDIETRNGSKELDGIRGLSGVTELPPNVEVRDSVVVLSVKEAIFKAIYPVVSQRMGFDEVTVEWNVVKPRKLFGYACYAGRTVEVRCSTALPSWVVSVALTRASAQ